MTSSPSSSSAYRPAHAECPACFNKFSIAEDAKKLSEQVEVAKKRIFELEQANVRLRRDMRKLKERIGTKSPVVRPFMPLDAPQPQRASKLMDLSVPLKRLDMRLEKAKLPKAAPTPVAYTREQMIVLFPPGHKENLEEMHRMKPAILDATLRAGNFDDCEHFDLLSEEQLSRVPLSQMSAEQIEMMFPVADNERLAVRYKLRMSMIRPEEVKAALEAGKLSGYLASYLPESYTR